MLGFTAREVATIRITQKVQAEFSASKRSWTRARKLQPQGLGASISSFPPGCVCKQLLLSSEHTIARRIYLSKLPTQSSATVVKMPTLRDITVHVTDSNKVKLQEWGVQTLRGHNKVSSYIKSETDMAFQIMIQPKMPYIASDAPSAHDYETRMRGTERPGFFRMEEDEWEDIDEDYDAPGMISRPHMSTPRAIATSCLHLQEFVIGTREVHRARLVAEIGAVEGRAQTVTTVDNPINFIQGTITEASPHHCVHGIVAGFHLPPSTSLLRSISMGGKSQSEKLSCTSIRVMWITIPLMGRSI